jgi:NADPH:quinone reductase-like Zn-dependent oxidoreductase
LLGIIEIQSVCNIKNAVNGLGLTKYCILGSDQKLEVCKEYGADVVINYKTQNFAAEVLSSTADRGIIIMYCKCNRLYDVVV